MWVVTIHPEYHGQGICRNIQPLRRRKMRPQAAFGHDKMQASCRDTHLLAFYPIFLIFSASKRLRTRINKGIF